MGMFFNSWKDGDAEYYYGAVSDVGSSNYNRGYDDGYDAGKRYSSNSLYNEGYEDAKKEFKKSFDSAYNKGFRAGLELYMEKKEPLKKDALEILMDELELNELLRNIELEPLDVQYDSEPEYELGECEPECEPESVLFSECEPESAPDEDIGLEPPIYSPL